MSAGSGAPVRNIPALLSKTPYLRRPASRNIFGMYLSGRVSRILTIGHVRHSSPELTVIVGAVCVLTVKRLFGPVRPHNAAPYALETPPQMKKIGTSRWAGRSYRGPIGP